MSDTSPQSNPDAQSGNEDLLPPRLRLFKRTQATFDKFTNKLLDAVPNHIVALDDYEDDEITKYNELLQEKRTNNAGMGISLDCDPKSFRGFDKTALIGLKKMDDGLFMWELRSGDKPFYPASHADMDDYADVVVSAEMQPFMVEPETDIKAYMSQIVAGQVQPDYLTDDEAQQLDVLIEGAVLNEEGSIDLNEFAYPDYWLGNMQA